MTIEQVRADVAMIKRVAKDNPEHATTLEYELYVDVLQALDDDADLAHTSIVSEALKATHIDFERS